MKILRNSTNIVLARVDSVNAEISVEKIEPPSTRDNAPSWGGVNISTRLESESPKSAKWLDAFDGSIGEVKGEWTRRWKFRRRRRHCQATTTIGGGRSENGNGNQSRCSRGFPIAGEACYLRWVVSLLYLNLYWWHCERVCAKFVARGQTILSRRKQGARFSEGIYRVCEGRSRAFPWMLNQVH